MTEEEYAEIEARLNESLLGFSVSESEAEIDEPVMIPEPFAVKESIIDSEN